MSTAPADIDPNPPNWVRTVISGLQANEDNHDYANKVTNYEKALADWVMTNITNRANGFPLTAAPVKPQRLIFYPVANAGDGEGGRNGWKSYLADVDPALPNAVLPPPVPTQPAVPILGQGSPNTGGSDPPLAEVLRLVRAMAAVMQIK
jgi:hypothetical protein